MPIISLPEYFAPLKPGDLCAIKQATGVERLYVSVITGRCGSTFVADICSRIGFGFGEELFNEQPLSMFETQAPDRNFVYFLTQIFAANVVNGTLYFQITPTRLALLRQLIPGPDFDEQTDVVTLISRRNILSQAISFHNAVRTGLWHTNRVPQEGSGADFDPKTVLAWIRDISEMEKGLFNFVFDAKPKHFFYEDIISSPYETISLFLGAHRHRVRPIELTRTFIETSISKKISRDGFNLQYSQMLNNFPWINKILLERMENKILPQDTISTIFKHCPDIENVAL